MCFYILKIEDLREHFLGTEAEQLYTCTECVQFPICNINFNIMYLSYTSVGGRSTSTVVLFVFVARRSHM